MKHCRETDIYGFMVPQGLASTLIRASERGLELSKRYLINEVIQESLANATMVVGPWRKD